MSRIDEILGSGSGKPTGSPATGKVGEYVRKVTKFHAVITSDGGGDYPAESGRYHVYIQKACPWSHRVLMVLALKGLLDHISYTNLDWLLTNAGWRFTPERPDPLNGKTWLREVYGLSVDNIPDGWDSHSEFTGKVTVPVLFDKKTGTIVSNESSEIIRMLNSEFNAFATHPELDLYPKDLRPEIDSINAWVYPLINDGVYRTGFSTTQEAYEAVVHDVFRGLDKAEDILSRRRYLTGDRLTEADIRLFATLVRFDNVYNTHFKCSLRRLTDYPNLFAYTREIYQIDLIKETVDFDDIRKHYFLSHRDINPFGIIPAWTNTLDLPHTRASLPSALVPVAIPAPSVSTLSNDDDIGDACALPPSRSNSTL